MKLKDGESRKSNRELHWAINGGCLGRLRTVSGVRVGVVRRCMTYTSCNGCECTSKVPAFPEWSCH